MIGVLDAMIMKLKSHSTTRATLSVPNEPGRSYSFTCSGLEVAVHGYAHRRDTPEDQAMEG